MKPIGLLLVILLVASAPAAAAETVSRIAAVVNDDVITTYQLDQALKTHLASQERQLSPSQREGLRLELLNRLIEETLFKQRIRALNLTVSEEELETAIRDVQEQNRLTRDELKAAVLAQGLTFEAYRDNLSQQILRYKLIGSEVRSKVEVSEREVVAYYRAHLDEYRFPGQVRLSAISFPVPARSDEFQREAIRLIAGEARQRLVQGEELKAVVEDYRSGYRAAFASLGAFSAGEMEPEFAAAIEAVAEGGYSLPVEKPDAVHLLRVDERLAGGLRQFDSVKHEIQQLILDQKTDARIKEWARTLQQQAFIDIRL